MLTFVKSKVANNRIFFFILELKNIKFTTISIFSPFLCHEVRAWMPWMFVFWMLSLKPAFSPFFFIFIKRFFSSSSLSAIRLVSSAYLRSLIFLLVIVIPACEPSSPAFPVMYSAHKLNKPGDNTQFWYTPFSILNQFNIPCPVLIVSS